LHVADAWCKAVISRCHLSERPLDRSLGRGKAERAKVKIKRLVRRQYASKLQTQNQIMIIMKRWIFQWRFTHTHSCSVYPLLPVLLISLAVLVFANQFTADLNLHWHSCSWSLLERTESRGVALIALPAGIGVQSSLSEGFNVYSWWQCEWFLGIQR